MKPMILKVPRKIVDRMNETSSSDMFKFDRAWLIRERLWDAIMWRPSFIDVAQKQCGVDPYSNLSQELDTDKARLWTDCVENFREQNQDIDVYNQLTSSRSADASRGATGTGWVKWREKEDESRSVFIDPTTMSKTGNVVKMWHLINYRHVKTGDKNRSFLSVKTQTEYDCKHERLRLLYYSEHSEKMATGNTSYRWAKPFIWQKVPTVGSMMEGLWSHACGRKKSGE